MSNEQYQRSSDEKGGKEENPVLTVHMVLKLSLCIRKKQYPRPE